MAGPVLDAMTWQLAADVASSGAAEVWAGVLAARPPTAVFPHGGERPVAPPPPEPLLAPQPRLLPSELLDDDDLRDVSWFNDGPDEEWIPEDEFDLDDDFLLPPPELDLDSLDGGEGGDERPEASAVLPSFAASVGEEVFATQASAAPPSLAARLGEEVFATQVLSLLAPRDASVALRAGRGMASHATQASVILLPHPPSPGIRAGLRRVAAV